MQLKLTVYVCIEYVHITLAVKLWLSQFFLEFLKTLGLNEHYWCSKFKRNQHMRSNVTEIYQR